MAIREISAELWGAISGGNGYSNYEAGGAGKKIHGNQLYSGELA
ncbi:hypothetical protein AB6T85_08235 [Erwinia sp. ACCC 02193]|uniref:Uncharacterized protein n=1 Tax=Erwinia aeris TaxID=3239803 RepID=A0ABV4E663_9GAMM